MDTNNWRPNQGAEPNMDTSDWRAQLQPESRQRIVNKIMEILKRHLPVSGEEGLHELRKIAQRFEEKIFSTATSETDYLRKISLKLVTIETKSQGTMAYNIPPNQVGPSNQPPDPGMQTSQHSAHMLQHGVSNLLPYQAQQSQPHQQLMTQIQYQPAQWQQQPNPLQQYGFIDQQIQLYQSQRLFPETKSYSIDSAAQTGQPSGGDWQEVYQKIKAMKENYLPELSVMYQKIATKLQQHDSLPHQPKSDQLEKLKVFKMMLERLITFLEVSKSNISPTLKENLGSYEKQIINFININRPRKMSSLQSGQPPPPHMHPMSQTQPQVTQRQELHQMNDVSDMMMRQGISVKPGGFEQHLGNALAPSSGKPTVTEELMHRLIKAVSSLSPAALSAAVSDISSVISMIDRIAASAPGNGSRVAVGEDLVAMTNCHLQDRNFIPQDGADGTRRMKRRINATPLNGVSSAGCVNDSIKQLNAMEASDLEPTATSNMKRPKIEF